MFICYQITILCDNKARPITFLSSGLLIGYGEIITKKEPEEGVIKGEKEIS